MTDTSKIAKFVNIMEFPINMRAHWMPGNPAICIPSGGTVDGPYDVLVQYKFFKCIGLNVNIVETQTSVDGEYKEDPEEIVIGDDDTVEIIATEVSVTSDIKDISKVSNTPKDRVLKYIESIDGNWVRANTADLEDLCNVCGVFIENVEKMNKRSLRWEYIRLLKDYIKS